MNFTRANLTDKGKVLNAKIQKGSGDVPLLITRIEIGAGTGENPVSQESLVDPIEFFVPIIRQQVHGSMAEIQIQITNVGNPDKNIPPLLKALTFQQIGFYAVDPDDGEILYRISQLDGPAFIPPASDFPFTVAPIYIFTTANADNVQILVDPAGLVTIRMLREHDNDPNAHRLLFRDIQQQIDDLKHNLVLITSIPVTAGDHFSSWKLYENQNSIRSQLGSWQFSNATLTETPSKVSLDINTNMLQVFAAERLAGNWLAIRYKIDTWLLTAANMSLILVRS